jgi:hypothetical protein
MSKPSHRAYVISNSKEGTPKKSFWREIGVCFPHKTGKGFDIVIHEAISVSGRIVCTVPKEKEPSE